jgi:hypothetical protein
MHVAMQKLFMKKGKKRKRVLKKWTSVQENKTMGTLMPA